jgi:NADH:ubiquinone reductase (H+-translocating)
MLGGLDGVAASRRMSRPRIVILGGGFAGYYAARSLCRSLRADAEVVILNPTDYFL